MERTINNITGEKIFCTIAVFFLMAPANTQIVRDFLSQERIVGKVKTITEIHNDGQKINTWYNEKGLETARWFFNPPELLLLRATAVYDTAGRLLEEATFDKGISLLNKTEYGYDRNGLPIGRTIYGANNRPLDKFIYQYDANKKITDSVRYDLFGNLVEKYSWKYDNSSRIIVKTGFLNADSSVVSTSYEYSKDWKITRQKRVSKDGKGPEITFLYDEKGNLVSETHLHQEDGKNFSKKITYDSTGNIASYAELNPDGSIIKKFSYEYDNKGRKIAENWYNSKDFIFLRYTHLYDEKDNEIAISGLNPSGIPEVKVEWTYEYDKTGNWVKKTQTVNGFPGETITRVFEYYE